MCEMYGKELAVSNCKFVVEGIDHSEVKEAVVKKTWRVKDRQYTNPGIQFGKFYEESDIGNFDVEFT